MYTNYLKCNIYLARKIVMKRQCFNCLSVESRKYMQYFNNPHRVYFLLFAISANILSLRFHSSDEIV